MSGPADEDRGSNPVLLVVVLGVVALGAVFIFVGPALWRPGPPAEYGARKRCAANLRQIGLALAYYESEEGAPPPVDRLFAALERTGSLDDRGTLECRAGEPPEGYETWSAGDLSADAIARAPGRCPVAWDSRHDRALVLYLDGSVAELDPAELDPLLDRAAEELRLVR